MGLEFDFSKVEKRFNDLERKLQKEIADKALDAAEDAILNSMIKNVPVDTAELKSNLGQIKRSGSGISRKTNIGINSEDRSIIERGYYQEYGHTTLVGKHWMKKSFNESKTKANEAIIKILKEELF